MAHINQYQISRRNGKTARTVNNKKMDGEYEIVKEPEPEVGSARYYGYEQDCCEERVDPITLLGK